MMIDGEERGWALMRKYADAQGFDKQAVRVCRKGLFRNSFLVTERSLM